MKQSDGDTADAALHTIAEEYITNGEAHKARAVYYPILTVFQDDEYRSIRETAQTQLKRLDNKEQRKMICSSVVMRASLYTYEAYTPLLLKVDLGTQLPKQYRNHYLPRPKPRSLLLTHPALQ